MNNKKDIIREIVKKFTQDDTVEEKTPLIVYGIDSLKLISIVVEIEEKFDIEIPDEKLQIDKLSTLSKIVGVVEEICEGR